MMTVKNLIQNLIAIQIQKLVKPYALNLVTQMMIVKEVLKQLAVKMDLLLIVTQKLKHVIVAHTVQTRRNVNQDIVACLV
jgi:predicted unusual protein kinase regulating ubiquinone biosynthesis (AarF/ABC1/UbiB family)